MQPNVQLPDKNPKEKPGPAEDSKTLARGLQIMDVLLNAPPEGLRVVQLCHATGLERATVHRLLATLEQMHYASRISRFHYGPGPRWQHRCALSRSKLAQQLQPVLQTISAQSGDASFAVVREGGLSVCIARQRGAHAEQVIDIQVGTRQPLGVGAAGLALLSALSDRDVAAAIEMNDYALPLYRGMTAQRLHQLVAATRERGWAVVGNHVTRNVLAVGMPVFDASGDAMAGISVATTQERLPKERQRQIAQLIRQALRAHGFEAP